MICKKCGNQFEEGIFCPECGTRVEESTIPVSEPIVSVPTVTKEEAEEKAAKRKQELELEAEKRKQELELESIRKKQEMELESIRKKQELELEAEKKRRQMELELEQQRIEAEKQAKIKEEQEKAAQIERERLAVEKAERDRIAAEQKQIRKEESEGKLMATLSLIAGLGAIFTLGCFVIPEILGIVFALKGKKKGKMRKMAIAGLVLSIISSVIFVIVLVWACFA